MDGGRTQQAQILSKKNRAWFRDWSLIKPGGFAAVVSTGDTLGSALRVWGRTLVEGALQNARDIAGKEMRGFLFSECCRNCSEGLPTVGSRDPDPKP